MCSLDMSFFAGSASSLVRGPELGSEAAKGSQVLETLVWNLGLRKCVFGQQQTPLGTPRTLSKRIVGCRARAEVHRVGGLRGRPALSHPATSVR